MRFNVQFKTTNQRMGVSFRNLQTVGGNGTGKDGLSAYEVAVKNGFEGTEKEWLASLKGEPGPQGPAGADGRFFGTEHAGKLLYVGDDGIAKPLALGDGLEIVDGVLRITGTIAPEAPETPPETEVIFEDAGGGMVLMSGVEFATQPDGAILIGGASFADQGDGMVMIN